MRSLLFLSSLLLALSVESKPASAGQITICNHEQVTLEYARVWEIGLAFLAPRWKQSGWHLIEPGGCRVVVNAGEMLQYAYFSIRYQRERGPVLMQVPLSNNSIKSSFADGVEIPFCVSDKPFERIGPKLEDLRRCPAGHYLQIFNVYVQSAANSHFTLDVGK